VLARPRAPVPRRVHPPIANGKGLSDRRIRDAQVSQANFGDYVRTVAADGGSAGEIERAKQLLDSGAVLRSDLPSLECS
jgi:hypothetical protein